jgi:hypothetical protein
MTTVFGEVGGKADILYSDRAFPLLTQSEPQLLPSGEVTLAQITAKADESVICALSDFAGRRKLPATALARSAILILILAL